MYKGSIVALVTPFSEGRINIQAVRDLVEMHLKSGTSGIVPAGTTGEAPTLTPQEFVLLVKTVKERCAGKIPVIAGVGTNSTEKTIQTAKAAADAGADGLLVVTPYYNKPTQQGLILHYEAVAAATPLPIVLYNVPGRTGVNMAPETVSHLARTKNIVALKEAAGLIEQVVQIRGLCDLPVLSGDDSLTYSMMALGGVGVISVAANIIPGQIAEMCNQMLSGDAGAARTIHEKYTHLFKTLFIESNPIPIKTALKLMGKVEGKLRLPLCPMASENEETLKGVLKEYDLI